MPRKISSIPAMPESASIPAGTPLPGKKHTWKFISILLLVILLGGAFYFLKQQKFKEGDDVFGLLEQEKDSPQVLSGQYQAVFLDSGQVYFGKLTRRTPPWYRLESVFYFRQTPVTPQEKQQQDVSIVKLGSEVHGPKDFMDINLDHILFIEELGPDSKVLQAIVDYESKKPE